MSKAISAEFYALYKFKKVLESCAQLAYATETEAANLTVQRTALPKLENAKSIHTAWNNASRARKAEAAAIRKELNAAAQLLKSVAELYGWTDAELSRAIQLTQKYR